MKQLTGAFHLDAPGPRQKKKEVFDKYWHMVKTAMRKAF